MISFLISCHATVACKLNSVNASLKKKKKKKECFNLGQKYLISKMILFSLCFPIRLFFSLIDDAYVFLKEVPLSFQINLYPDPFL